MGITDADVRAYREQSAGTAPTDGGAERAAGDGEGGTAGDAPPGTDAQAQAGSEAKPNGQAADGAGEDAGAQADNEGGEGGHKEGGEPGSRAKARINELTGEKAQAQREAAYWRKVANNEQPTAAEAQAAGQPYKRIAPPEAKAADEGAAGAGDGKPGEAYDGTDPADPAPQRADFEDPDTGEFNEEQYLDARLDWRERKAKRLAEHNRQAAAIAEQQRQFNERWEGHRAAGREKYPDFAEVVEARPMDISAAIGLAIVKSDAGPDLAYYLAKHPEEAERIMQYDGETQLLEMGRLETKVLAELVQGNAGTDNGTGEGEAVTLTDGAGAGDGVTTPAAAVANGTPARRETSAPPAPSRIPSGAGDPGRHAPKPGTEDAVAAEMRRMRGQR